MKGFIKGIAGVAAVLFAIGIGAILFGVFTGGSFVRVPIGNSGFSIFSGWNNGEGFDWFDNVFYYDNDDNSQNEIINSGNSAIHNAPKTEAIDTLKFEIGAANCKIVYGDEFKFETEGRYKYESKVSGSTWKIEMLGKNFLSARGENVTITLPKNMIYDKVEFDFGAGNFDIEGLETDILDIEIGAGNMNASNIVVNDKTKISCGASNVEVDGMFNGKNDFECGAGRLVVNFDEKPEDYGYSIEMGLGHVKIFDETFGGIADRQYNTGADVYFDVECGEGSLEIN